MATTRVIILLLLVIIFQFWWTVPTLAIETKTTPLEKTIRSESLSVEFKEGLFSVHSRETSLGDILAAIEKQSGLSISIDEGLKTKPVTVSFSGLDIIKSLRMITNADGLGGYGLSYRSTGTPGDAGQWVIDTIVLVDKGSSSDVVGGADHKQKDKNQGGEIAREQKTIEKEPYFDKRLNRYVEVVKGEVLVKFAKDVPDSQVKKYHKEKGTKLLKTYEKINAHRLKIPVSESVQGFIEKSLSDKSVYVEPVFLAQQQFVEVNDPSFPDQWAIPKIEADKAWEITNGSPEVIVAVIDTGIDILHPDLKNKVIPGINILNGGLTSMDDNGHGTFVAGIIAAEANNSVGITGLSWQSSLMPVKVLTASGEGTYADLLEGIIYAVDHGARVLNLSLGGYSYSQFLADAVQYAHSNKAIIIAAGGNENIDTQVYPAAFPNVIAVSATDSSDQRWYSSNHGAYIKLSAPGVGVISTMKDNRYAEATGTSVSTAHVSGVAALVLAKNPAFSNTQIENILYQTADDLGDKGWDSYYGAGRVNALKAIEKAGIEVHDVAVTGIRIEPETFKAGEATKIIVTVENQGTFAEKGLVVNGYFNNNHIGQHTIDVLEPGVSADVVFDWLPSVSEDHTGNIKAVVDSVTGESDTTDNEKIRDIEFVESDGLIRAKYSVPVHQWITRQAVAFLNGKVDSKVITELNAMADLLSAGAKAEDKSTFLLSGLEDIHYCGLAGYENVPFRWLRHFYRPLDRKGYYLKLAEATILNPFDCITLENPIYDIDPLKYIDGGEFFDNSSTWGFQNSVNSYDFKDAVNYYHAGYKESAYYALGHVLHLIEDASLPEHTHLEFHGGLFQNNYESFLKGEITSEYTAMPPYIQQALNHNPTIVRFDAYPSDSTNTIEAYIRELAKRSYTLNRYKADLSLLNILKTGAELGRLGEVFPDLAYDFSTLNCGVPAWYIPSIGCMGLFDVNDEWWETATEQDNTQEPSGYYYIEQSGTVIPQKYKTFYDDFYDPVFGTPPLDTEVEETFGTKYVYVYNTGGYPLAQRYAIDLVPLAIRYVAGAIVHFYDETHPPTITTSISITPQTTPYYIGQTISARFAITNKGATPITVAKLTVGGRDPDGQTADFPFQSCVTLQPNVEYIYEGQLTLTKSGSYSFFPAYETTTRQPACPIPDDNWNTAIPAASGVTQHTLSNPLNITVGNPYYTLSVSPVHQPVPQGKSVTFSTSVSGIGAYNGTVGLQVSITPYEPTITAAFSQTNVTPPTNGAATSILTISTTASTPKQTYIVSVQSSDGSVVYTQTATLTVGGVINIGGITINTNTTWMSGNIYNLTGVVTVNSGVTLTIEPGVVVKGNSNAFIIVNGTLRAVGTSGSPIVFTSYKDDTVGGDTNGDGASTPASGDWGTIVFNSGSTNSILDYTVVRYGGYWSGAYCGGAYCYSNLWINSSSVTVQNSTISDANYRGIWIKSVSPVLTGNTIEKNSSYGLYLEGSGATITGNVIRNNPSYGIYISSSSTPTISGNTISNQSYGIYNGTSTINVLAESNYWGADSGPLDSSDDRATGGLYNPTGAGNRVTDKIDYDPWLSTDPNVKTYYSLNGTVYDNNTHAPVSGVVINLGPFSTNTNTSGSYSFNNLAAGNYTIRTSKAGYVNYTGSLNLTATARRDINLTAQTSSCAYAQSTLTGYVKSALTNNPIPSATVNLNNGSSATTDSNGHFELANQPSNAYTLTVNANTYVTVNQPVNLCGTISQVVLLTKPETTYGTGTDSGYSKDPVNTATGNYTYSRNDMEIPGIGLNFIFERNYNSQDAQDGPLGFGWNHSYNSRLDVSADTSVSIRWGDGRTETWTPDGAGGFTPQYGVFDTLIDNGDGTYTLKKKDQTRYNFDSAGTLASIVDKNGNIVNLTYTGSNLTSVADTAGRVITFNYDTNNRIAGITDPLPRTVEFTYDSNGDLVTATDMNGDVTTYTYDANHQILMATDPLGNIFVTNIYDDQKRVVVSQKDAKEGVTVYLYDEANRKTTIIDQIGNPTIHYHDELLRLIQEKDARGYSTYYTYDEAGNRTEVKNRNGKVTKYAYDSRGNVTSKTDALNIVTTITYDANNNPLSRTEAVGTPLERATTFEYDASGNLIKTSDYDFNDILLRSSSITYYANGLPNTMTDYIGNTTTNTYDTAGNLVEVTNALGKKTKYTYDAVGRRLTATDALGRTTTYDYDNNNNFLTMNELAISDPLHRVTAYTYDKNNNRLTVTDPKGKTTQYAYDVKDLLETITDPYNKTITYTYDPLDRKKSVTDKNGNGITYDYDEVGNLTKVIDPYLKETAFTYDANRNKLTETDPLGHTTTYKYDALNRVTEVEDPLGNTTTTVYDALGRVSSTTNAKLQTTLFEYDALSRLTKVTDSDNGTVQYTYDANGNRLTMVDPNDHTTSYEYDALNRLIIKTEPYGQHEYGYDDVGNMKSKKDPKGNTLLYQYDALDRLEKITYPDATSVSYTYDANDNRISMTDSLGTSAYNYDDLNRMTSYTDPFGKVVRYGYDNNGNRTSLIYPDGKVVNYDYDKLNRLSSVTDWLGNTTTYSYDDAGNLSDILNPNNTRVAFAYDNADRLTGLSNTKSDSTVISSYSYTLDALGNHENVVANEPLIPFIPAANVAYTYDSENRMTSVGGVTNTFDDNGNMTGKGSDTFTYDYHDRLAQSTVGGVVTQYSYDGVGNRLVKVAGGITTRYIIDINGSLSNVLAETDAAGTITAHYVHGLGLISKVMADGTAYYYHYDSRGSTIALTDASQNITDAYAYDPFGRLANSTGTTANPFRYVGRYGVMEEGNGLSYIRARYYIPELARFITKDPLTGKDGDSQSLNRYVYALNNPVIFIDADGRIVWVPFVAGAVIGATVSSATYIIETSIFGDEFKWSELGGVAIGGAIGGTAAVGLALAAPAAAATTVGAIGMGAASSFIGSFTEKMATKYFSGTNALTLSGEDFGDIVASTVAGGMVPGISGSFLPGIRGAGPKELITSLIGAHARREIAESIAESIVAPFMRPTPVYAPSNGANTPFINVITEVHSVGKVKTFKK